MNNTTKNLMTEISKQSSLILLVFALLSFASLVVFKSDYYHQIFTVRFTDSLAWVMGVCIALIVEGIRLAFLLSSAEDARVKNWYGFTIGLCASIGLLGYELYVCKTVGTYWDAQNPIYTNILRFLAIIGMVIEVRLCLLIKGSIKTIMGQDETPTTQERKPTNGGVVYTTPSAPINVGKYFGNTNQLQD